MIARAACLLAIATTLLASCHKSPPGPQSLVGNFPAPGIYALAGDTLTIWRRVPQSDGLWRFQSWAIGPGGQAEALEEMERVTAPAETEETVQNYDERRTSFALPQGEFEAIRARAALLRPQSLGPDDPAHGYGGQSAPRGCELAGSKSGEAGINYLNGGNWGSFVLQPDCRGQGAEAARAAMADIFARLEKAGLGAVPLRQ